MVLILITAVNGVLMIEKEREEPSRRQIFKFETDLKEPDIEGRKEFLWELMELFDFNGSRYSRTRLRVVECVGDKYQLREGEELEEETIYRVKKKEEE